MEKEKCLICDGESQYLLPWRFNNKDVALCNIHTRAYQSYIDPEALMTEDQHCSILYHLIKDFDFQQIQQMQTNTEHMDKVMNSWQDGCLSNREAVDKMLFLSDETRRIALKLKGGE